MKSVIAHHYWGRPGGGQLVSAGMALGFKNAGYDVILVSSSDFKCEKYMDWFGINICGLKTYYTIPWDLRSFGIYMRLLIWKTMLKAIKKENPDFICTDECTYKPLIKKIKKTFKFIEYVHFPIQVILKREFKGTGYYYGEDPYLYEKYSKFPMNIYFNIYIKLLSKYVIDNPFNYADMVFVNSQWTANICEKVYGEKPIVLNPPISNNVKVISEPEAFEKRNDIIVMLGRFSPEKRYHWVLTKVFPILKEKWKNVRLVIFGGAKTPSAMAYFRQIRNLARKLQFKVSDNIKEYADVYLIPDAPRTLINMVMNKSKIFLHATINEHWGIVVAEAMALGLPVVVHKSGGAWSDLIEKGKRCLGYNNEYEAVEAIIALLNDEKTWYNISFSGLEKAKDLIFEKFIKHFQNYIKTI